MGEVRNSKKARIFTVFLILSLVIVSFSPVILDNSAVTSSTNKSDETTDVQSGTNSESAPSGPSRPVTEYALGTRSSISVNLPSSPNAYVDLGSGWIGNSAIVNVTYLWDSRNHAVNGTFDYGSGTSSPPWSFSKYDPGAHATFTGSWVQNSPQSGVKDVYCQMPLPSGSITFSGNERVSWNETILPLRGTVLSAVLTFDWWPVVASGFTRSEFVFYSTVNNTRLVGVGSPFPWQVNLKDVASNPLINNRWNTANFTVPTSAFSLPSSRISVEIGIMYTSGSATYTGWNSQNIMYIDNVKLVLQCYVKPHQINLKVKPQGGVNSTVSDTGQYGSGIGVLKGFTTSGTSFPFIFAGGNLSSPNTAGFTCTMKMNATRSTSAVSTFETYSSGQKISWTFSLWTYFSQNNQPIGSGTYYTKYYFNLSVPLDYNFTTCKDPGGYNHDINSEPYFKNWTLASSVVLRVNVTQIGNYTGPTNPTPYMPYEIHALSNNYVKEIFTQVWDGAQWVNSTNFYPQNQTKIAAHIAAGSTPVTGGIANLTIYGPPAYNTTPLISYKIITGYPAVNGYANFMVTWNSTAGQAGYVAGNYTVQVDWVNTTIGEAGSLQYAFNITHKIKVRVMIPGEGDVVLAGTQMVSPPATVSVRDYYTDEFVKTVIKARVKWQAPGKWDTFTSYSVINATYTNMTQIPSGLGAGTTQWFAVNASAKPYFDEAKTNSTFLIGWDATISPSSQVVSTYCTEKSNREIVLNQIYYYNVYGGSPVTNATITVVSEASSNDSALTWNLRFNPITNKSGSGYYYGTVKIGTDSALSKAIPPCVGYSYTIVFKLSASGYVQTRYFTLSLVLFPSPSSLDILSGVEQSVFWGQTATFTLNFTAQTPSLPTLPVYNSSIYAPPYVSVYNNWTGSWSVSEVDHVLYPGEYRFIINTSAWTYPTPDGSGAGTVKIRVSLGKLYYLSAGYKDVTVHIKSLTTSMTGATGSIGSLTLTNTTWVYSGDQMTLFAWYNDTHGGTPAGVSGASLAYALKASNGTTLNSGVLQAVTGKGGLYNLTLPKTIMDLLPGTYFVNITASKYDYYVRRSIIVTLDVRPIPTAVQAFSPPTTIYYLDEFMFLMWFNDTHNDAQLTGAVTVPSVPAGMEVYTIKPVLILPGLYNLTVPGVNPVGEYIINVTFSKAKYASGVVSLPVTINKLPTILAPFVNSTSGLVLVQQNVTAQLGTSLTIYLWFNDTRNSVCITGAENEITYRSTNTKWGPGFATPVSGVPGLYKVTLQISDAGAFDITFNATLANYDPQTLTLTVNVPAPPAGFSLATLMLVGFGGGGIVVAGVVAWLLMRRARIPFIIKKIDETMKLINKGEHEQATPVPLKSREESIVGITQERIESFSKRKAAPGAAEAVPLGKAAEEAAAAAPPAEVEAALKKELKAVEPGKPEEEIEEVEMETLDEELGRLERVDTGQEVPEGAKQARDVIDEYKKRKKKR